MDGRLRYRRVVRPVRQWFRRHGRSLPWRGISDPYRLLLSEIMLQQTQVSRVLVRYPEFLRRFPTLRALAQSPLRDVVLTWRGMGYNNRAVRLHALARILDGRLNGRIPDTVEELLRLPGIGRYTACALLSAVYGRRVPVVDVNVRRVLSRLFFRMTALNGTVAEPEAWKAAERLLPARDVFQWNQALMDLGATVCTARAPGCPSCPVARWCMSRGVMRDAGFRTAKKEPGRGGIPNRIYRGRIIEELRRTRPGQSIGVIHLGRRIHPGFAHSHVRWLGGLLKGLQKDGLIVIRPGRGEKSRRITLA
ncbi:MAG: A/G-specific adenine glycosylase [Bacteroidota bacterium]